ncbi:MAG TPA: S8 family serine peptidase [Myxococcota bacterium]|nr:S8 family serine peptidase [Myxococcota bacterium]
MKRRLLVGTGAVLGAIGLGAAIEATRGGDPTGRALGIPDLDPPEVVVVEPVEVSGSARGHIVRLVPGAPGGLGREVGLGLVVVEDLEELDPAWVAWAEEDQPLRLFGVPDDPMLPYQWNLSTLGLEQAWTQSRGDDVVVAVLDTGATAGPDGLPLLPGLDVADGDDDPSDDGWHGTHVSGVIAQTTNNGTGTAAVSPGVSILPVRVMSHSGGSSSDLVQGIVWAVDNGADVLNLSLGVSGPSTSLEEAIDYAENQGVVVVAATGNDGLSDGVQYPAAYETVLAVGATTLNNDVASYSNRGAVDLYAPGGDIDVDVDGDGLADGILAEADYEGRWQLLAAEGTSVAAPHVSGAAALLIANGASTPAEVRDLLISTGEDLGFEGPLVDPAAALAAIGDNSTVEPEQSYSGGGSTFGSSHPSDGSAFAEEGRGCY